MLSDFDNTQQINISLSQELYNQLNSGLREVYPLVKNVEFRLKIRM